MAVSLGKLPFGKGPGKWVRRTFGGLDRREDAGDGAVRSMTNMTGQGGSLFAREPRWRIGSLEKPNGLFVRDGIYTVDGTAFYADGVQKGTVTDSPKTFASLGPYVVILPDKAYYHTGSGVFGSLEARAQSVACRICDGTYAGEPAEANTLRATAAGFDWGAYFRPGDAVTVAGAVTHPENNVTIIVREIQGAELRFYPNSFVIGEGGDNETLTVSRTVPEMDFIFENDNRLWGCKGDEIFACKPGDPFNWNVFDGLDSDAYAAQVGSAGDFTGACSYLGYPVFFKEENIYKVYGTVPSNYQLIGSATLGVAAGSGKSLAVAGETLCYLSRAGVVAYGGGIPSPVGGALGDLRLSHATAGSDGLRYYLSAKEPNGDGHLLCYDSERGLWFREDALQVVGWGYAGGVLMLDASGTLWQRDGTPPAGAAAETGMQSAVELGDFCGEENARWQHRKTVGRMQLRLELSPGAQVTLQASFDGGAWETVGCVGNPAGRRERTFLLPWRPRRCDQFRLRLNAVGGWSLRGMSVAMYDGSELR